MPLLIYMQDNTQQAETPPPPSLEEGPTKHYLRELTSPINLKSDDTLTEGPDDI